MKKTIITSIIPLFFITHLFADTIQPKTITYNQWEIAQLTKGQASAENEDQPQGQEKIELYTIPSGGFHDSLIRVAYIFGGYMVEPWGKIIDEENRITKQNKFNVPALIIGDGDEISYSAPYYGCEVELMFPSIKYVQQRRLDFTGIKFGLKGRYSYSELKQSMFVYTYDVDLLDYYLGDRRYPIYRSNGKLLQYNRWEIGPVVNFIFSPHDNLFNALFHTYLLLGYVSHGKLRAMPSVRKAGYLADLTRNYYYSKFNGCSISIGLGPHFVLNQWIPITIGFNLNYTYTKLFFDKKVPIYNSDKKSYFQSMGLEFSAGFHLL